MKVTVNIPADAPTGDRYATVWAQPAVPGGGGVVSTSRVGVRMDVRVGPGAGTTADFTIDGLTAERDAAGQAVVVADVRNTGGWATEVGGELTLTDGPAGRTLGPLYADEVVVAAGAGAKVRFRSRTAPNYRPGRGARTSRSRAVRSSANTTGRSPSGAGFRRQRLAQPRIVRRGIVELPADVGRYRGRCRGGHRSDRVDRAAAAEPAGVR